MTDSTPPIQNPEATVNKVSICITCGMTSTRICSHCGQDFCDKHSCYCMYETKTEPLTEEDGTVHEGRRIRLIGEGWPNEMRMLKDLSEDELRERIAQLKSALKWCIQQSDYTKISLAAHEFELDYREHSNYVKAIKRRKKHEAHRQGILNVGGKRKAMGQAQQIPQDLAALMKGFGLSYEDAVKLKAVLGGK